MQVHGANNASVLAAYDIKEKVSINAVKNNDFGRLLSTLSQAPTLLGTPSHKATDSSSTDIDSSRTALLPKLSAGGAINISAGNTITTEGVNFNGASFTPTAQHTQLMGAIDSREVSHTVSSRNTLWQSSTSTGSLNQTLHMTNVNVPVGASNFQGAGGISVQPPLLRRVLPISVFKPVATLVF